MAEISDEYYLWDLWDRSHGFFNYRDGNNPYYDTTVFESHRFLAFLGYLAGISRVWNKRVKVILLKLFYLDVKNGIILYRL